MLIWVALVLVETVLLFRDFGENTSIFTKNAVQIPKIYIVDSQYCKVNTGTLNIMYRSLGVEILELYSDPMRI